MKPGAQQAIHPVHYPLHHYRHGHRGFPGLNSHFGEAITEYYSLASLDELKSLVANHCPELMSDLDRILAGGISLISLVVDLLQIDEASERLKRIRELIILGSNSELLVILPLPPHITNRLLKHIDPGMLLTTSYHMPPHLHGWQCDHIDGIMPDHLLQRLNSTKAIAVEGMYHNGELWVPTNIIKLMFIIQPHYPNMKLFVHNMPHVPRHLELAKLTVDYQIHTI